jgi:uncharacterized phage-associated protein
MCSYVLFLVEQFQLGQRNLRQKIKKLFVALQNTVYMDSILFASNNLSFASQSSRSLKQSPSERSPMRYADARQVAQYILCRRQNAGDAVTPMQLIKLTYIAQGQMLGRHGRPLFSDAVEAWQYGPVVPSVYHAVKEYRSQPVIEVNCGLGTYDFTATEMEVMDLVADKYGDYDGIVLSSSTHQPGTPWEQTWSRIGKNTVISNDIIKHFYRNILSQKSHSAL